MAGLPVLLGLALPPAQGQQRPGVSTVDLTVKDVPLRDALNTISRDTGYQFNLPRRWEEYKVSATIHGMPLAQGLKRLLRSLNYTIIWESDNLVTIRVYGKAEPGTSGRVNSLSSVPRPSPEEAEPADAPESPPIDEVEPDNGHDEAPGSEDAEPEEGIQTPENSESTPEAQAPGELPARPRDNAGRASPQP